MWRSDQLSYRTLTAPSDARDARPRVSFEKTTPAAREPAKAKSQARRPSRKEVFQPHLPVRLPCYDLAPITGLALTRPSRLRASGTAGFHGLTGGVYKARERIHRAVADARLLAKARERIHRAVADARLLANPASWSRVAGSSPNWDRVSGFAPCRHVAALCAGHCNTCVAPDVRAVLI